MNSVLRAILLIGTSPILIRSPRMESHGTYRREFTLPGDWDDKEIFLSADGVRGAAFYYLNGKFVGMSKDAKTPARFNVSAIAKKGKNVIAIQIHRFSDANYLECQDFWRISGIERDIYLYAQPQIPSHGLQGWSLLWDENYRNGILKVKVQFTNESGQNSPLSLVTACWTRTTSR